MKINSSIKHIKRIFNIADIHIRLFKRSEEYDDVFNNLYSLLKEENADADGESIIVVTGDIVHTKTEMSPEMVRTASQFLKNLGDICPTIIIPGNHDANLNNMQRLDAITPLIEILNHPNIYYLKETGLYEMGDNVVFSNMCIFDDVENYIKASDVDSNRTKIAIFHGTIDAAVTDSNFRLRNKRVTLNLFDGYDVVLIGDIHRHQVMQLKNEKENKPYVVYPSSLIQQNYGELLDNHGILIWDIETKEYEFKQIKNNYGFFTVDVDEGKIISDLTNMPQKPRIRVLLHNTSAVQFKECLTELRTKYNPIEVTHSRIGQIKIQNDNTKIDLNKIRDVNFQNILIEEYLFKNFPVDQKIIEEVFEINKYFNKLLPVQDAARNVIWKLKTFTFSNMFSYGEDNVIDFSKLRGIAGLFAANTSGKSSILDALTFCLFDKCSRAFKASHILNNRKDKFTCELNFEIDGVDYFIKKIAKRDKKDKVSVKIDFWRTNSNGDVENLNGDERKDTSTIISSFIGTYDDFILTTISSQYNSSNFIDLGQTNRQELLSQFMDINIFDVLFNLCSDKMKEYAASLKSFQKRDFDKELSDIEIQLKTALIHQSTSAVIKNNLQDNIIKHTDFIIDLTKKLVEIDASIEDIDVLMLQKNKTEQSISTLKKEFETILNQMANKMEEYNTLKHEISVIDSENLKSKYKELQDLEAAVAQFESQKESLKIHVQHKLDKIQNLGKLEYDPSCKYCMNNVFVKDAIQTQKDIDNDVFMVKELLQSITRGNEQIEELIYIRDKWNDYETKLSNLNKLKMHALQINTKKSNVNSMIERDETALSKINEKIELYHHSKDIIENNKKIGLEITNFKSKLEKFNTDLRDAEKEFIKISSNVLYLNKQKDTINSDIKSFKEIEEKYTIHQYYLEAVKRDGIPYELIAKTIPVIESEVNNILNQIVDFSIMIEPDGKNINAKIVYDENKFWLVELVSGMERFIVNVAIRMALLNVSSLPRSTFIAIDEGFSSLDADNASNLPVLLDYLRTQFDFSLIISHNDYMRDFVDISLNLKKENDFSKIVYN